LGRLLYFHYRINCLHHQGTRAAVGEAALGQGGPQPHAVDQTGNGLGHAIRLGGRNQAPYRMQEIAVQPTLIDVLDPAPARRAISCRLALLRPRSSITEIAVSTKWRRRTFSTPFFGIGCVSRLVVALFLF
jgi:hypothetical protein